VSKPTPRRKAAEVMAMLVTFSLGLTLAVLVAGSASAASSKTTPKKTTTTTTTKTKTTSTTPSTTSSFTMTTTPQTPADYFLVLNSTVNAASDHEIVGSSAFPNFTTGAVDNYYSMAHSHVDNSPFAEGTASPADTGPIGQTAAAGNFQQPQYADARWPGASASGKATYGTPGQPYATAEASEYRATADASEATNGLSGPGLKGSRTLPVPEGFDLRLRDALAAWKAKWQSLLPKRPVPPSVTTPVATVTVPTVTNPGVTVPKPGVTTPTATVPTPITTITPPPPPPVTVTTPPSLPPPRAAGATRSPASFVKSQSQTSASTPADGESLLTSSTQARFDPKTYTLRTSGESSVGRVSLGGGQIVIEGIHVSATIASAKDGVPHNKYHVYIAAASIGGVPVTIDQDGVHVAGQGQGLPYQQASDSLNSALKQAGIQLFLVSPEVTTNSCAQTGMGTGTTASSTSNDQSGTASSCDQTGGTCNQSSAGTGTGTGPTTSTTSSYQASSTTTPSSCAQPSTGTCGQSSAGAGTGTTTTTGGVPGIGTTTTTTTTTTSRNRSGTTTPASGNQSTTTTTTSGCDQFGTTGTTSSCPQAGSATGTTTTSTDQSAATTTTSSSDQMGSNAGTTNPSEETVTATGLHVVFTQPASPPGVPAQFVEHIIGEVFIDSLAVPAPPVSNLDLSSSGFSSPYSSSSSSCLGGGHSGRAGLGGGGGLAGGGSSLAGGSNASGSLNASGSAFGSNSQAGSSSTGNSLPAAFAAALKKPLWLLLAYLVWQALVIGTGWSLWNWRRGGAS